ncbi:AraC family transcriptional regulator [Dyella psychrodurans]|uniref:AraC family transcriptional regulator n=1 Tax=Dyella psychrodurans TaxID=1927960 RepID=A0A370X4V6_9GAMM|nr:AraC family transcriptional regulator [Dyella psychrodurans]RDS83271.1 AraC family transcriptional regulator [Dyella psychrodurans]
MYLEHSSTLADTRCPPMVEPALESLLSQSTLRVDIVAELQYCGSWFMDEPRDHCGLFHLVGAGECMVESPSLSEPLRLHTGDLVLLPHGDAHSLRSLHDDDTAATSLICGELHFSSHTPHPLSHALPTCFVVRAAHADQVFRHLTSMMVDVVNSGSAGRRVLLNKLADTLFTLAVCDYASRNTNHRGLFAALGDTRICKVLQAIHENPGQPWTMQTLASLACMSRSAFAERFAQLMKVPPMQYVTQWRVSVAERMLRDRQLSVASIAEELGYSSEAAFRRLFKRVSGICPGRIRSASASHALN